MCVAAVCLAGCGRSESSIRGSVTRSDKNVQTETAGPETAAGPELSLGSTSGNRWENEFIGIGCKLDENWTFMTDEEIRELNQFTADMAGEELKEAMESADLIYDMAAMYADGVTNVNVNLEKLSGAAALIDEETYVGLSEGKLEEALTSMGLENIQTSSEEITFAGKSHYCIYVEGEMSGAKLYEAVVAVKCSGYMSCISVATWGEDIIEELLGCFYGL